MILALPGNTPAFHNEPDQDALISYLKNFLINMSRIKLDQQKEDVESQAATPLAIALKEEIEAHFKEIHNPSGYAGLLHSTTPTLNRLTGVSPQTFRNTIGLYSAKAGG